MIFHNNWIKTSIKVRLNKSDEQTKIDKYRVFVHKNHTRSKLIIYQRDTLVWTYLRFWSYSYRDALFIALRLIFLRIIIHKKMHVQILKIQQV